MRGIAIDWVTKQFYFGDTTGGELHMTDPVFEENSKIYSNVGQVRDVVIDSLNGYDYIHI